MSNAYLYLNVQTTGGPRKDIVELGGVLDIDGEVNDEFWYFILPKEPIIHKEGRRSNRIEVVN